MLKMTSTSINGLCKINGTDVVYFSATFSQGVAENFSISKNIINTSVYKENRSACEADYLEFEAQAEQIAANMESGTEDTDQADTEGRNLDEAVNQDVAEASDQSGTTEQEDAQND